jgi:hypothetical protein
MGSTVNTSSKTTQANNILSASGIQGKGVLVLLPSGTSGPTSRCSRKTKILPLNPATRLATVRRSPELTLAFTILRFSSFHKWRLCGSGELAQSARPHKIWAYSRARQPHRSSAFKTIRFCAMTTPRRNVKHHHGTANPIIQQEEAMMIAAVDKAIAASGNAQIIGRNGELPLIQFFNRHLPYTIRAHTGHFVAPDGLLSPQLDVVLVDARYPLLAQNTDGSVLVMLHSVLTTIEVKTRATSIDVVKSLDNARIIHELAGQIELEDEKSVLAPSAITATQRGSLIDSPKPELGERNGRPRGKDEQTKSWRLPGITNNKSPRQWTLRRASGKPLDEPAVGGEYETVAGERRFALSFPRKREPMNMGFRQAGRRPCSWVPGSGCASPGMTARLTPARRPGCRPAARRATGSRS